MVLMPGFQSTRLVTEGALEPFFFLYTDDSIQGNPETCKQSSVMLNYEVKNSREIQEDFDLLFVESISKNRRDFGDWNKLYKSIKCVG